MRPLLVWALRFATGGGGPTLVVQNPDDAMTLGRLGITAPIVLIRGSGVDTRRFVPLPEPDATTPLTVALVGRMLRSKGVPEAVAAVSRLRAQGFEIALALVGGPDPDNRDSLTEAELTELAVAPGITWRGHVDDVRTVWAEAAIAVLPSTYGEGLPRALLEAAACGRPIIATDVPGCREVVRHGETGLLVPPGDPAALADAVIALARDPIRRRAMGDAARRLVEREFAEELIVEQTLALYRRILDGAGAA